MKITVDYDILNYEVVFRKENNGKWSKKHFYNEEDTIDFIVRNRGGGKTFGTKEYIIKRFLNHGEQFIYVRRYKTELKGINKFFNDIKDKFPNVKLEVKGQVFYINDEAAGQAVPLSTAKN